MSSSSDDERRIGFFSISDRPELADVTQARLREYCSRHGYELHLLTESLDPSRHVAWSKLTMLRSAMRRHAYDWYVWIDDDVYLTRTDVRIEDLLAPYPFAHVLASRDVSDDHPLNSGVLVLKRTATAEKLLRDAYLMAEPLGLRWQSPWEQGALAHLYRASVAAAAGGGASAAGAALDAPGPSEPSEAEALFRLVPHTVLQSFHRDHDVPKPLRWRAGHFAAHLTGMPLPRRLLCLQVLRRALGEVGPSELAEPEARSAWPHEPTDPNPFDPRDDTS